jgi:acyl-coenzyme A synthetase/AMP-(fatty) acid ligase
LHDDYPETVYRTGDLAHYNAHGELVFVGRRDGQIKRMGHRIESGEIEHCASSCAGVGSAVCVLTEQKELVLFYVGEADEQTVMAHLRTRLPRYYLPARLVKRRDMPMTDNGKVDRRALMEE